MLGHPDSTAMLLDCVAAMFMCLLATQNRLSVLFHCEARFKGPTIERTSGHTFPYIILHVGMVHFSLFFVFPFSHVRPTIKYDQKGPKVVLRVKKIGGGARSTRILLVSQKDITYTSQSSHHSFVFFLSSLGLLNIFFSLYFARFH